MGTPSTDASDASTAYQQLYNQWLATLQSLVVSGNTSTADLVTKSMSGSTVDTLEGWNESNGTSYQQITTTTSSGQITVAITGQGDVATFKNNTTATINGSEHIITAGNNNTITLSGGGNNTITMGNNDTIIAGTTLYPHFLNTDTITFEGNAIAGNIAASGYQDQYGRAYTLNTTTNTLTITGKTAGDLLTISNFVNGDFGVSMNAFESLGSLNAGFTGFNSSGVMIGTTENASTGYSNEGVLYNATTGKTTFVNDPSATNDNFQHIVKAA